MRRDDRDDPFDDIFREIERMMDGFAGGRADQTGFGEDAHFSVYGTDEQLRVVGDLPGVAKSDVSIRCDGRYLTVAASSERREYEERVTLPDAVDEHTASATFNNGVLEVTLEREDDTADIDLE